MWEILIPILIAVAFVAIFFGVKFLKKKKRIEEAWQVDTDSRATRVLRSETPTIQHGRKLYYEKPLTHDPGLGDAFNRGILHSDEKAACAGYPPNPHPTAVVVFPSELSPESRVPCFRVAITPHNAYYNSEWDMMRNTKQGEVHYVLAAGQMIRSGSTEGFICVLPHCSREHYDYFATVADYEREHDNLLLFDGPRFEETKNHATGGHPLIPECSGSVVSVDQPFFAASRGFDGCVLITK